MPNLMCPRILDVNCLYMAEVSKSKLIESKLGGTSCGLVNQQNSLHNIQHLDQDTEKKRLCRDKRDPDSDSDNPERSNYYCMKDLSIQSQAMEKLEICGWYYSDTSSQLAKKILHKKPIGNFIVRDSSDPNYLYAISVKTSRGTTSVRILYHKGYFQLDCDERLRPKMPKFDCVVRLVDFYVRLGLNEKNTCRWLESSGRKDLPVVLKKPQVHSVPDLKHLCRMKIVDSLPMTLSTTQTKTYVDTLPLPTRMKDFIKWYPFLH